MTTRAMQPGNTDPVACLKVCNARPERDNDTGSFLSGRERKIWLHRPIAVSRMQVGVANPARHDFHQGLPRPRPRHRKVSHHKWLTELLNDCSSHNSWDWHTSSSLDFFIHFPSSALAYYSAPWARRWVRSSSGSIAPRSR